MGYRLNMAEEAGKKYGELTVIDHAGRRGNVICSCSCGNICIHQLSLLKGNIVNSCGCICGITRKNKRNTTGIVGVFYLKKTGTYRVRMSYKGKVVYNRESFHSIYDAIITRRNLELQYYGKTVIDLNKLREDGII